MRPCSSALRLVALLVGVAATAVAQQEPKPRDLPDAPTPKQANAPRQRQNPINTTIEVLERRSIFFPEIATSPGPLSAKQKFELFAGESVAPSRFLRSAAARGSARREIRWTGMAREWAVTGKVSALRWPRRRRGHF